MSSGDSRKSMDDVLASIRKIIDGDPSATLGTSVPAPDDSDDEDDELVLQPAAPSADADDEEPLELGAAAQPLVPKAAPPSVPADAADATPAVTPFRSEEPATVPASSLPTRSLAARFGLSLVRGGLSAPETPAPPAHPSLGEALDAVEEDPVPPAPGETARAGTAAAETAPAETAPAETAPAETTADRVAGTVDRITGERAVRADESGTAVAPVEVAAHETAAAAAGSDLAPGDAAANKPIGNPADEFRDDSGDDSGGDPEDGPWDDPWDKSGDEADAPVAAGAASAYIDEMTDEPALADFGGDLRAFFRNEDGPAAIEEEEPEPDLAEPGPPEDARTGADEPEQNLEAEAADAAAVAAEAAETEPEDPMQETSSADPSDRITGADADTETDLALSAAAAIDAAEEEVGDGADGAPDGGATAPTIDMGEIEELIRRVMREELAGEMGQRLSRNIKQMIQDEVAHAILRRH